MTMSNRTVSSWMLLAVLTALSPTKATASFETDVAVERLHQATKCDTKGLEQITTSKGSKEVRREIEKKRQDAFCAGIALESAYEKYIKNYQDAQARADAKNRLDKSRAQAKFRDCLKRNGLTEKQFSSGFSRGSKTCSNEWVAALGSGSNYVSVSRPEAEHKAWITAWADLGQLASVYPDSFKPSQLPGVKRTGAAAEACLRNNDWCYNPGFLGP